MLCPGCRRLIHVRHGIWALDPDAGDVTLTGDTAGAALAMHLRVGCQAP